jgi:hypothetical protein
MAAPSRSLWWSVRLLAVAGLATSTLAVGVPLAVGAADTEAACQEYSVCGAPTGEGTHGGAGSPANPHSSQPTTAHVADWIRLPLAGYPLTPAILALLAAVAAALGLGAAITARARSGGNPPSR